MASRAINISVAMYSIVDVDCRVRPVTIHNYTYLGWIGQGDLTWHESATPRLHIVTVHRFID